MVIMDVCKDDHKPPSMVTETELNAKCSALDYDVIGQNLSAEMSKL
jgi:hypothetical protein